MPFPTVPDQAEHQALDARVTTLEAIPDPTPSITQLQADVTQLQADVTKLTNAIQALVTSWTT